MHQEQAIRPARTRSYFLLLCAGLLSAQAPASFQVIDATTVDVDGTITVWDGDTHYRPKGVNHYVSAFTYLDASGAQHSVATDNFAAFTPTLTGIDQAIQPTSAGSQPLFSTGEEYLHAGERGLSTSTAINMVAGTTAPQSILFDLTDALYSGDTDNVLLLADAADNQSSDWIGMLDAQGNELFSLTLGKSDWWKLGVQTINRIKTDGSGYAASGGNTDTRALSFAVLSWEDFGVTSQLDLDPVTQLEFRIPKSGSKPRTDYAFLAANTAVIQSPDTIIGTSDNGLPSPAGVALPATWMVLLPGLVWLGRRAGRARGRG